MNDDPYYDTHYVGLGEAPKLVTVEIEQWGYLQSFAFYRAEGVVRLDGVAYPFWFSFAGDAVIFYTCPPEITPTTRHPEDAIFRQDMQGVTGNPRNSRLDDGQAAVLLMDFAVKFALSQFGTPAQ